MKDNKKEIVKEMAKRFRNNELVPCISCKRFFRPHENRDCDICLAVEAEVRFN